MYSREVQQWKVLNWRKSKYYRTEKILSPCVGVCTWLQQTRNVRCTIRLSVYWRSTKDFCDCRSIVSSVFEWETVELLDAGDGSDFYLTELCNADCNWFCFVVSCLKTVPRHCSGKSEGKFHQRLRCMKTFVEIQWWFLQIPAPSFKISLCPPWSSFSTAWSRSKVEAIVIVMCVYMYDICAWFQQTPNVGCTTLISTNDPARIPLRSRETSTSVDFSSRRSIVSLVFELERSKCPQIACILVSLNFLR